VTKLRTRQQDLPAGIGSPRNWIRVPRETEELFAYQGLIYGSVEAGYFTASQQDQNREFAGRRVGAFPVSGRRFALAEGGWAHAAAGELLPVLLPEARNTFHRDQSTQELTPAGRDSVVCRLEETPEPNAERWKKMPLLANYNEVGAAKPGALVLMEGVARPAAARAAAGGSEFYGRGRTDRVCHRRELALEDVAGSHDAHTRSSGSRCCGTWRRTPRAGGGIGGPPCARRRGPRDAARGGARQGIPPARRLPW